MSWQAYVDDHLVGTGKVSKAAIIGKQGGIWAASSGYTLSQKEQDAITKTMFQDPDSVRASGITLNGFKFMAVRVDSEQVIGRKGQRGVFIIPTQQAILIAEYDEPIQAAETSVVASKLAEYLTGVGY